MASTDRVSLGYKVEATFGTTPAAPDVQLVDITSEDFKAPPEVYLADQIVNDRMPKGHAVVGQTGTATIGGRLSYSMWDEMFEALLQSAVFDAEVVVEATSAVISAASPDNSYNTTGTWDSTPTVGQIIQVAGFTGNTVNNGYSRVVSATFSKIIVEGRTLVTEAAGDDVTVDRMSEIVNATTERSYSWRRKHNDLSSIQAWFRGFMVDSMRLSVRAGQAVELEFGLIGKDTSSSTVASTTETAAPTNGIFNAANHVPTLLEADGTKNVVEFSLNWNNNLRTLSKVGQVAAYDKGSGQIVCTGSLQSHFADHTTQDKAVAGTASDILAVLTDGAGKSYIFSLPTVNFTSAESPTPGPNADVIESTDWVATKDTAESIVMRIARDPNT